MVTSEGHPSRLGRRGGCRELEKQNQRRGHPLLEGLAMRREQKGDGRWLEQDKVLQELCVFLCVWLLSEGPGNI